MNLGSIAMLVALGVIALVGLFAAAHAADIAMTIFGGVLTLFGVLLSFWFLKRHFDEEDARRT